MAVRLIVIIAACTLSILTSLPCYAQYRSNGSRSNQAAEEHRITILSIIPAQGEPGTNVTLSGSGFTAKTVAYLGNNSIPTEVIGPKQLSFIIPDLAPGLYALFLRDDDGTTSRAYNFSLLPPKPVVYSLSPDTIQVCASDREREVIIEGKNFQAGSQVLFDGAAINGKFLSSSSFSVVPPRVAPGLHQIQIKNLGDTLSGAQGLFIDGRPEIDNVTTGDEYVNFYNLTIHGRNFQQDSTVVITEERDIDQSGNQSPTFDVKRLRSGSSSAMERDRVIFVGCGKLVYQRYPYSSTPKNFRVQVINPGGEESSVVQVSAP